MTVPALGTQRRRIASAQIPALCLPLAALQVLSAVISVHISPCVPALQLCKGVSDEEAERYCIPADAMQRFHYLSRSGCTAIEGVDDAADFVQVKHAMAAVSIAADDQGQVSSALLYIWVCWHTASI